MSEIFAKIFRYIPRETKIALFGWQHWLYIISIIAFVVFFCFLFHKKDQKIKDRVLNVTAVLVISIYVFDIFVQPFWNDGEISINKLPFHICTLVGVLIPFVNFSKKFHFMQKTIVVWATLAPLMFILFPMNYINRAVEPYSYPIIQTFAFHGLEFFWGVFMLTSKKVELNFASIWQPIVGLFPMALWATIGQELYSPDRTGENFLFLRTDISAYAPQWLLVPALFVASSIAISLLYLICFLAKNINAKKKSDAYAIIKKVCKEDF